MKKRNGPFHEIYERMNKLLDDFSDEFEPGLETIGASRLPLNVRETEDKLIVTADMPGVEKENIKVRTNCSKLQISAETKQEKKERSDNYIRQERRAKNYSRSLRLPSYVDPESAEASYKNGVLKVEMDKEKKKKGKEIEVE